MQLELTHEDIETWQVWRKMAFDVMVEMGIHPGYFTIPEVQTELIRNWLLWIRREKTIVPSVVPSMIQSPALSSESHPGNAKKC